VSLRKTAITLTTLGAALAACNTIAGIGEPTLVADDAGDDATIVIMGDASGGPETGHPQPEAAADGAPCNAASCPGGCCDTSGHCATPSSSACGTAGGACTACDPTASDHCDTAHGTCACGSIGACSAGQHCMSGACTCNGTSCTGCCGMNGCATPSFPTCGAGGAACVTCDMALSDSCDSTGHCACGSTAQCAQGQRCSSGKCVCDAMSCASGCCSGTTCTSPSPMACGLGAACVNCQAQVLNASGVLCSMAGACDYSACAAGFADVDGNRANGCESTTPKGVAEAGNLVLWLDGDLWNGSTWPDSSGGGRTATTYVGTVGKSTRNGHTVADFSAGGSELLINAGFPNWNGLTVMTAANTIKDDFLITMGVSYNPGCTTTAPLGAPGCVAYDMLGFGASMGLQQCDPGIGSCYQAYATAVGTGWLRTTAEETPSANPSFHTYSNGADEGVLNHNLAYPYPSPWSTPRTDAIVAWRNYQGYIGEIIVFNVPLSDASRQALDTYLANKWAIH
jgi:hypothetical protein